MSLFRNIDDKDKRKVTGILLLKAIAKYLASVVGKQMLMSI